MFIYFSLHRILRALLIVVLLQLQRDVGEAVCAASVGVARFQSVLLYMALS